MSDGIDTMVGVNGEKISGGQLQRLAIARTLMNDSKVILLDDISTALDIETEFNIISKLKNLSDKTFLIATNSKLVIDSADNLIVLNNGHVVSNGTKKELLESCVHFQSLYCK